MTPRGEVPVEVVQRAFRNSGMTFTALARELGWLRTVKNRGGKRGIKGDGVRLKRQLGLLPHHTVRCPGQKSAQRATTSRYVYLQHGVGYDRAVELVRAMGLDPVDYDL